MLTQVPEPVFFASIEPNSLAEMAPLERALECLAREDPTFRWRHDADSGQLIVSGMGELHLDVLCTRIQRVSRSSSLTENITRRYIVLV